MSKKKDGPYKKSKWTSNFGRLTEKGNLKNGGLDGVYEEFHKNGQLQYKRNFKNGEEEGQGKRTKIYL